MPEGATDCRAGWRSRWSGGHEHRWPQVAVFVVAAAVVLSAPGASPSEETTLDEFDAEATEASESRRWLRMAVDAAAGRAGPVPRSLTSPSLGMGLTHILPCSGRKQVLLVPGVTRLRAVRLHRDGFCIHRSCRLSACR